MLVSCFGSIAPVTGVYSDWSHWSQCSASCGGGTQERTRKCFFSKEAQGGVDCSSLGPSLETRECNALLCPGKRTILPCCKGWGSEYCRWNLVNRVSSKIKLFSGYILKGLLRLKNLKFYNFNLSGLVTQSAEQRWCNQKVVGSVPTFSEFLSVLANLYNHG